MFDPLRPLLRDLPLSMCSPSIFVSVARRTDVRRVPATDTGRTHPLRPVLEGLRTGTGGLWWRTDYTLEPIQVEGQGRTQDT